MPLDARITGTIGVIFSCVSFITYTVLQHLHYERHSKEVIQKIMLRISDVGENHNYFVYSESLSNTWPFVASYQCLWIVYSLITIFRWNSLMILPSYFYVAWCGACCFDIGSLILSANEKIHFSLSLSCAGALFRIGCLFFTFHGLFEYLAAHSKGRKSPEKFDVFCQRALLQNGLLCFQAWSSFKVTIQFAQVLQVLRASKTMGLCISLMILGTVMIGWFLVQNFYIEKYTRYTVAEYVTLALLLGSFFEECKDVVNGTYALVLFLLFLTVLACAFRILLIIQSERERKYATDGELEFML